MSRLAHLAVAHRRITLIAAVVLFVLSGALGGNVAKNLSTGGFEDPTSESFKADAILRERFDAGVPNVVLLVTAPGGPSELSRAVDDPAAAQAGLALTAALAAEPDVTNVVSYWSLGNVSPLRSEGGDRALVLARVTGDEDHVDEVVKELDERYGGQYENLTVEFSGFAHIFATISEVIESDLVMAEMIAIPITLVLLLFVFRSVVAAMLPLVIGALSVVSTFLVLQIINMFTDVSVFALNMTTAMGLGLAIDYALFVVNRYREELAQGFDHEAAISRTVRTAGRTVAFSAGTVAASLLALLVFPIGFLKSFAYAGVAVGTLAGFYSVLVLPALLAALGPRIDSWSIRRSTPVAKPLEQGFWYQTAMRTMRRPLPVATAIIAILLFVGIPFLRLDLGLPDDRVLPVGHEGRVATDIIRDEFDSSEAGAVSVVADGIADPTSPDQLTAIDAYAKALSLVPNAARVDSVSGIYVAGQRVLDPNPFLTERFARPEATFLSVVPTIEANSPDGEALVKAIRDVPAPFEVRTTGAAAQLTDAKSALLGAMPLALLIISGITFALLFLLFGSVVVPLKALVLNLLSLTATFGAMVWVFQDGHLSHLLGFDAVGTTDATAPILMFCVAFGLSMDYEVFLLSRIKEEYDRTGDNERSVAIGLERTGRIVTAAAILISVVFFAFGTSDVRFIKLFGIGLAIAVLMDAFVIRGTLVPAFMKLADSANWWAPGPLRRFHDRFGISEHVDLDEPSEEDLGGAAAPAPLDVSTERVEAPPASSRPRRERPLVAAGRGTTDQD